MRRRLSSKLAFLFQITLPVFWLLGFGAIPAVGWASTLSNEYAPALALTALVPFLFISIVLIYMFGLLLKAVSMDDAWLYVSNFRTAIRVPLADVDGVGYSTWDNKGPIKIYFGQANAFGQCVKFLPFPAGNSATVWPPSVWFEPKDLPAVRQLRAAVARAQGLAVADAVAPETAGKRHFAKPTRNDPPASPPLADISTEGPGDIRNARGKR
jgi:hypothetical protein